MARSRRLIVEPVTADRWSDLETLFGERGACGGCWCMTPRLSRKEYEAGKGEGNRRRLRELVEAGPPPGVLGYLAGENGRPEPVAWCAIGPRQDFGALARSRILAPLDDEPVWSITCLFIRRDQRRHGHSVALVEGAVALARSRGARIVEAYPTEPQKDAMPDAFAWTGILATYLRAGFREVLRRSATRPIVRRAVRGSRSD